MTHNPTHPNVTILSSFDRFGGAAIAANRLHTGLHKIGVDSTMLVWRQFDMSSNTRRSGGPVSEYLRRTATWFHRKLLRRKYGPSSDGFRAGWPISFSAPKIPAQSIAHAQWVSDGFVQFSTLENHRGPVVLTLHDMWWFTGGCHYDGGCGKFRDGCGKCPLLRSESENDLSRSIHKRKAKFFQKTRPLVIAPSEWLANLFSASPFSRHCQIEVVPYWIDTEIFNIQNRGEARVRLGLPSDIPIVMFGAFDVRNPIKGWDLLLPALAKLKATVPNMEVLVVGHSSPDMAISNPVPMHFTGNITDERQMSGIIAAANVLVVPSREENFPNTIIESLACGVPAAGFRVGGIPELIQENVTGAIADPFSEGSLTDAIIRCLDGGDRMRSNCREEALRRFSDAPVRKHLQLYEKFSNRFFLATKIIQNKHQRI